VPKIDERILSNPSTVGIIAIFICPIAAFVVLFTIHDPYLGIGCCLITLGIGQALAGRSGVGIARKILYVLTLFSFILGTGFTLKGLL
jgi:hypothetical protein